MNSGHFSASTACKWLQLDFHNFVDKLCACQNLGIVLVCIHVECPVAITSLYSGTNVVYLVKLNLSYVDYYSFDFIIFMI